MAKNWWEQEAAASTNWWEQSEEEETAEEYSAFRSGAVDFVESAVGAGDELDAVVRLLAGEADNWSTAINKSRSELRAFQQENPTASNVLTGAGMIGGFFIPGMGIAKIGQYGSKLDRALKVGGIGAAEGAVYGFLSGEEEEGRLAGAALGAGLGGVLGGAAGAVLTKGAEEVAAEAVAKVDRPAYKSEGTHIGGEEGFVNVGKTKEQARVGNAVDTSVASRKVRDIQEEAPTFNAPDKESGTLGNIFLGQREWFVKNVGERAARLAEDAETMIRHDKREIDQVFDEDLLDAARMFDDNPALKALTLRMNKAIKKDRRITWDELTNAARTPEEKDTVRLLKDQLDVLQGIDFVKVPDVDYFPTKALKEIKGVVGKPDDYDNPIKALKDLAEDISAARALAARFNIDLNKVRQPSAKSGESRLNVVIEAIEKEAKKQGASKEVAANLANGLRSQIIASQKGGNTIGAVARRLTSASLLANPLNAVLNIAEGVTSPIYQNGVKAWAQTVPRAVLATSVAALEELGTTPVLGKIIPKTNIDVSNWMKNKALGLDKDFMGEVANTGEKAFKDAAESWQWTKLPNLFVQASDLFGKASYKLSGVSTVNRMGQEILANTAIKRGMTLAKKGKEKDLAELRKHDGMRGLTESEFMATVRALKDGDLTNPWLINFAGSSLNKWQPVSASTLPKAFHDNPNARMAYSMLSYMNRQMNNIRNDIGLKFLYAQERGLNTKEGAQAAKEAMLASAKYAGLFGVFAGFWDDARKTLDLSNDKQLEDLLTPEGIAKATMNQLGSNISSGLYNMRAEEFGGQPIDPTPAPVQAGIALGSGVVKAGERMLSGEDEPLTPLLRASRTYAPGVANIDRLMRTTTGERLFEDLID